MYRGDAEEEDLGVSDGMGRRGGGGTDAKYRFQSHGANRAGNDEEELGESMGSVEGVGRRGSASSRMKMSFGSWMSANRAGAPNQSQCAG